MLLHQFAIVFEMDYPESLAGSTKGELGIVRRDEVEDVLNDFARKRPKVGWRLI